MTDATNPTTTTTTTTTPATAATAATISPSMVIIKDAQGVVHKFDIAAQLDEKKGAELYALLPAHRQKLAREQQHFIQNFRSIIEEIPAELRERGAMQKLMETIHKQGGYLTDTTSKEARAFMDGPFGESLRRSGLYKGYKTTAELGNEVAAVVGFSADLASKYWTALGIPFRAFDALVDVSTEKWDSTAKVTPAKALALASAYQGAMYMATESELAPSGAKAREATMVDQAVAGGQVGWSYFAVAAMAFWNAASDLLQGKGWNWDKSWKAAEASFTDGKGIESYDNKLRTNLAQSSENAARPKVEDMLRNVQTVAGVEAKPYLDAMQHDTIYRGHDGKVYQTKGAESLTNPVVGPNGTQLTQGQRDQSTWARVHGGLLDGVGFNKESAAAAVGAIAATTTYKGVAQGVASVHVGAEKGRVDKLAKEAADALKVIEGRSDAAMAGKKPHFWSKGPDEIAKLEGELAQAEAKLAEVKAKQAALPEKPVQALKADASKLKRVVGGLAEAAETKLPADATRVQKLVHVPTAVGQVVGKIVGHVTEPVAHFVAKDTQVAREVVASGMSRFGKGLVTVFKFGRGIPLVGSLFAGGVMVYSGSASADTVNGEKLNYFQQLDYDHKQGKVTDKEYAYYRSLQTGYVASGIGGLATAGVSEAVKVSLEHMDPVKMDKYLPESIVATVKGLVKDESVPDKGLTQAAIDATQQARIAQALTDNASDVANARMAANRMLPFAKVNSNNMGTVSLGSLSNQGLPQSTSFQDLSGIPMA